MDTHFSKPICCGKGLQQGMWFCLTTRSSQTKGWLLLVSSPNPPEKGREREGMDDNPGGSVESSEIPRQVLIRKVGLNYKMQSRTKCCHTIARQSYYIMCTLCKCVRNHRSLHYYMLATFLLDTSTRGYRPYPPSLSPFQEGLGTRLGYCCTCCTDVTPATSSSTFPISYKVGSPL